MAAILSFRDLDAWNVAMELLIATYALAGRLPASERYELSAQLRRSAVSIPSNIAEGHSRGSGAYRAHVRIALGSTAELDTQAEAAIRLGFISQDTARPVVELIARVGQLLHALDRSLKAKRIAQLGSALAFFGLAIAAGVLRVLR